MLLSVENVGPKGFHGLTTLDGDGDTIARVWFFDTESRQCWDKNGRLIAKAVYWYVPCSDKEAYLKAKHSLPEKHKKHAILMPEKQEEWPKILAARLAQEIL